MTDTSFEVWDFETDVLIVGSGAGGLCAGLSVNAAGRRSLVIEKNSTVGGASVVSGGSSGSRTTDSCGSTGYPTMRNRATRTCAR